MYIHYVLYIHINKSFRIFNASVHIFQVSRALNISINFNDLCVSQLNRETHFACLVIAIN